MIISRSIHVAASGIISKQCHLRQCCSTVFVCYSPLLDSAFLRAGTALHCRSQIMERIGRPCPLHLHRRFLCPLPSGVSTTCPGPVPVLQSCCRRCCLLRSGSPSEPELWPHPSQVGWAWGVPVCSPSGLEPGSALCTPGPGWVRAATQPRAASPFRHISCTEFLQNPATPAPVRILPL